MRNTTRYVIPLTLVLSFPLGLGLGHTIRDAGATSCPPQTEAYLLELGQIEVSGEPDASLRDFKWSPEVTLTASPIDRHEATMDFGPDQWLFLSEGRR